MSSNLFRVFSSSVGTKLLVGVTGLLLVAYMVLHLAGNVLILLGRDIFNEYSHKLISNPLIVPVEKRSGAMYAEVPMVEPVLVSPPSFATCTQTRSATRARP